VYVIATDISLEYGPPVSGEQRSEVLERPLTAVSSRHLWSANQHQLTVPRGQQFAFGHRAFSVAGPMVWNSLPTEFRDLSASFGDFRRTLKTILFARY